MWTCPGHVPNTSCSKKEKKIRVGMIFGFFLKDIDLLNYFISAPKTTIYMYKKNETRNWFQKAV